MKMVDGSQSNTVAELLTTRYIVPGQIPAGNTDLSHPLSNQVPKTRPFDWIPVESFNNEMSLFVAHRCISAS